MLIKVNVNVLVWEFDSRWQTNYILCNFQVQYGQQRDFYQQQQQQQQYYNQMLSQNTQSMQNLSINPHNMYNHQQQQYSPQHQQNSYQQQQQQASSYSQQNSSYANHQQASYQQPNPVSPTYKSPPIAPKPSKKDDLPELPPTSTHPLYSASSQDPPKMAFYPSCKYFQFSKSSGRDNIPAIFLNIVI